MPIENKQIHLHLLNSPDLHRRSWCDGKDWLKGVKTKLSENCVQLKRADDSQLVLKVYRQHERIVTGRWLSIIWEFMEFDLILYTTHSWARVLQIESHCRHYVCVGTNKHYIRVFAMGCALSSTFMDPFSPLDPCLLTDGNSICPIFLLLTSL